METRLSESPFDEARIRALAATPVETLEWAWRHMGDRCCVLSSMQDATVIELAMRVDRRFPVVFLDTGYHFPETWDTLRAVERTYGIEIEVIGPIRPVEAHIEPGRCCDDKPVLLERALEGRSGWISGVRRQQTENRASAQLVETDKRGLTKVNPIVQWSDVDHALFCLLYTSPSPRDATLSRMPSSA